MARGGARVGAGRPKKPLEAHKRAGTFRADRHGPRPAVVGALAMAPAVNVAQAPPATLLAGLGESGVRFLRSAYADFEQIGNMEGEVLRVAAEAYDDAAMARARGDLKSARAAVRQFLAALQRLGWPKPERVDP